MSASRRQGSSWIWIGLIAAVVLAVVLIPQAPRPYDLDSTAPDGYRGLRLLVEGFDTELDEIDASDINANAARRFDTAFVPLAGSEAGDLSSDWTAFVRAGGRLVLGSPLPDFGPRPAGDLQSKFPIVDPLAGTVPVGEDVCTIEELQGSGDIDAPLLAVGQVGVSGVEVGADEGCYGDGDVAAVVRRRLGAGEIVVLGDPGLFANQPMGAPDVEETVTDVPSNAVLAQRMLAPGTGGRLAVATGRSGSPLAGGEKTLTDFMSPGVKLGLWQLCAAMLILLIARGRRHGRIVREPAPVSLEGSGFVDAVGTLLERQGEHARAAETIRSAATRELALRHGLPASAPRSDVIGVVAGRLGRDPTVIAATLSTQPVSTPSELVELAEALEALRQEALHV